MVDFYGIQAGGDKVQLIWKTILELNTLGFNIYRSTFPDKDFAQINMTLIPSQASGGMEEVEYAFSDTTIEPGKIYFYRIEEISLDGTYLYGPIQVETLFNLYLPSAMH